MASNHVSVEIAARAFLHALANLRTARAFAKEPHRPQDYPEPWTPKERLRLAEVAVQEALAHLTDTLHATCRRSS